MHDKADVPADADGPEILILRLVELMKAHAGTGRIDLQVKGRRFDRLLLVAGEASKTISECVGDTEFHHDTLNTFMTSSPRWLMTLTATRPDFGLGNARDVSLLSVAHASASISALSVVLRALYGSFAPKK